MNRSTGFLLCFVALLVASITVSGQGPENQRLGFLSAFKEGQSVTLKEVAGRYEITIIEDVQANEKIIGIGSDYLTIEDLTGITETKIPVYSIKNCVRIKKAK